MKRILISLLCGVSFIILYLFTLFILEVGFGFSEEATIKLARPLQLASYIYYDVLHLQNDENLIKDIFRVTSAILINVVMYASVFYLALTLIDRRKPKVQVSELPPEPPTFEAEKEK